MKRVRNYFEALFLARWFVTTFALLALLSVVDSIGAADILPDDSSSLDALKYTFLRLRPCMIASLCLRCLSVCS